MAHREQTILGFNSCRLQPDDATINGRAHATGVQLHSFNRPITCSLLAVLN